MRTVKTLQVFSLAAGLCLLCGACATLGAPFAFPGPDGIVAGKTTKSELIAEFGAPSRVGYDNGRQKWAYAYYHYSVFGPALVKNLDVVFGPDGVVSSYTYESSDSAEVQQQLPAGVSPAGSGDSPMGVTQTAP
ncbi:MAG TPA: hypothetical protein VK914_06460 [bacterium]|jgi:hypothetical protein|nr:hypothetical protein [bacterium]